ncbi:aspartate aminotransferase family protein [Thiohalocapsa sp.]|uniref:aspartate aminotransferase family protein n=1 Tax=Thiohalocapsa sp. TaxID=2497641 RepID=UPI0025FDC9FE|nr:aspartate aminotransferase family protein [Thiohalocapsa sp.]
MSTSTNLDLWQQYGPHLLVLQPFMDSVLCGGEGCYVVDADGRRILDLAGGQFCTVLDYDDKRLPQAIAAQAKKLIHIGDQYVSENVLTCVAKIAEITPPKLTKSVLLSTGSEANECAMRMAKVATQRTGMLAYDRGYYGISLATRNLSAISDIYGKVDFQPTIPGQLRLITPNCSQCPLQLRHPECGLQCLKLSVDQISNQVENIAAVIVEPIISAGGMIVPPVDYVRELARFAASIGALFIADEAQTGFGRCGTWFDIEHYEVEPDILVFSKTSGNGYPTAGVVVSDEVARELESRGFTHLSSHQNDPLGAAVVSTVIDIIRDDHLVDNAREVGDYLRAQLIALQERHAIVSDVRGRGLMIGMALDGANADTKLAFKLAMMCERRGLRITFSYYEPVIRFIPPLTLTRADVDVAIGILDEVLGLLAVGRADSDAMPRNPFSHSFIKRLNGETDLINIARKLWTQSPQAIVSKTLAKLRT